MAKDEEVTETTEKKPKLSPAEIKKLFEAYEKAKEQADDLKEKLETANTKKSTTVADIADQVGKGPFEWKGRTMTIMKRGETFFFKGEVEKSVQKIG